MNTLAITAEPAVDQSAMNDPERAPCHVFGHAEEASRHVAVEIAQLMRDRAANENACVLGLATGSTPTGVYAELVRMHKEEGLSFKNVITFNLDEYFPIQPNELQSYVRFMNEHLFDHVDIVPENIHIPDGTIPDTEVADFCRRYEKEIANAGGIDLQLLGIGRTGHIGFNEPGSHQYSRTRLITLDRVTRTDAASDFFGEENVPRRAITMGVGTILRARRVVLMAWGEGKAEVVARAIESGVSSRLPASYLQDHPNALFVLDQGAADGLTRLQQPWLFGAVDWTPELEKKAVIGLSERLETPLLKLTTEDYNEAGLQELIANRGPAYDINLRIFRMLQGTISGWPAGKPGYAKQPGDRPRPGDHIFPKRVLIFSPHPDDDVISMGGTLIRMADQGHEVHVAYQTSGNIAVFDDDVRRFIEFATAFQTRFNQDAGFSFPACDLVLENLNKKQAGDVDSLDVQWAKGEIRRVEARSATRYCGIPDDKLHFMEMPFYETGRVTKKPLGDDDIELTAELLRELRPHLVFAAGDLSDPHGTHRTCLDAVQRAFKIVAEEDWRSECQVWLYRGAWQEWRPEDIEIAVPISPEELVRKRNAIFKHESQKDSALFPGSDSREFWERAEQRNRATACLYNRLGLAEYEAIEGFVRWNG